MARRKQFKGVCHDVIRTFASRYNDLYGYWALGHLAFLENVNERQLTFNLRSGAVTPTNPAFCVSAKYYMSAIFRIMEGNAMPRPWLADATIRFSIVSDSRAACEIELVSDLGKVFRSSHAVKVRPHSTERERRRVDDFGPSNQKGR
jgi:hypothetical protein